jgi:hypothetical protein
MRITEEEIYNKLQDRHVRMPMGRRVDVEFAILILDSIAKSLTNYEIFILEFAKKMWKNKDMNILDKKEEQIRKKYFDSCDKNLKQIYNFDSQVESRILIFRTILSLRATEDMSYFTEIVISSIDIGADPEIIHDYLKSNLVKYS